MTRPAAMSARSGSNSATVVQAVTVIMGTVVSLVTLALNVAEPLVAGEYGKAVFDVVGPVLLIGWAEVGPDLLRALTITSRSNDTASDDAKRMDAQLTDEPTAVGQTTEPSRAAAKPEGGSGQQNNLAASTIVDHDLLERAREADARHWHEHRRPFSADTLRRTLRIGAARSRLLITAIRAC